MPAWLLTLGSRLWGYVATAAAAIGAVVWFWLSAKSAGKREAERDALGKDLENRNVRDREDRAVSGVDDPAAELLKDWRRR